MQLFTGENIRFSTEVILASRERDIEQVILKNVFLNESNDFVATSLEPIKKFTPKFDMRGFFLHSSLDLKIKSVPVFMFSLQRRETMETYISCFYAEDSPELFELFNEIKASPSDRSFFFNWFEHETLAPAYPPFRGEISDAFFCHEGKFLDYRSFDATMPFIRRNRRLAQFSSFHAKAGVCSRFVRRSRFYKRKFNWFLKYSGVKWT